MYETISWNNARKKGAGESGGGGGGELSNIFLHEYILHDVKKQLPTKWGGRGRGGGGGGIRTKLRRLASAIHLYADVVIALN